MKQKIFFILIFILNLFGSRLSKVNATRSLFSIQNSPFIINILDAHNKYRKLHGVEPLKYSFVLSNKSQAHSDYLAENQKFIYSMNNVNGEYLGESIAMWNGFGDQIYPFPVELWYKENRNHNYTSNEFQLGSAHFTQMVWRNTRSIGIGFTKSSSGCYLVVNYYPGGNRDFEYATNVFKSI